MAQGILAGIPLLMLILGALFTRRITEPAFAASVVAVIFLYGENAVQGYIEKMYEVLSNPSFQLLVIVALGFGGLSALLEKSGAMLGFRRILEKVCISRKSALVFTWLLGGIIFVDDYLNALAVSASMKGISDRQKVPREHLAYTVNCMGACVCVMIPVSSWAAFAIGCASEQALDSSVYFHAIPFMFYPICAVLISLLLCLGKFPLLGELKRAYQRIEEGGSVFPQQKKYVYRELGTEDILPSSPLNFLVPMAALICCMLLFGNNIVAGLLAASVVMIFLLIAEKRMKWAEAFDTYLEGASTMGPMVINIFMAYIMETAIEDLGFMDYLTQQMSRVIPAEILPAAAFLAVGGITLVAASFWTLIVIAFPIFLPMASALGVPPYLLIAAVMSGVALGSQACLYSDAIFMVSAGTGVSNEIQFRTVLPYVGVGVCIASLLFLAAGFLL